MITMANAMHKIIAIINKNMTIARNVDLDNFNRPLSSLSSSKSSGDNAKSLTNVDVIFESFTINVNNSSPCSSGIHCLFDAIYDFRHKQIP